MESSSLYSTAACLTVQSLLWEGAVGLTIASFQIELMYLACVYENTEHKCKMILLLTVNLVKQKHGESIHENKHCWIILRCKGALQRDRLFVTVKYLIIP
jgi:hypothetical protein